MNKEVKKNLSVPLILMVLLSVIFMAVPLNVAANESPVAIVYPKYQEVEVGEEAWFTGNSSYDPDGYVIYYSWHFGDGETANGSTVTHIYSSPGTYVVWLYIYDNENGTASDSGEVTVLYNDTTNEPPVAEANPYYQEVSVGEDAWLYGGNSYDPDGKIVSYEWDFGDGSSGSGMNISHAYTSPGMYYVVLTVTDDDGATDTDTVIVNVTGGTTTNEPPVAVADPYYQTVGVGESAWFSGSNSYDPDGTIVSYEWDFGDGSTGSGMNIYHSYTSPGMYYVVLTVTDDEGATGTDTVIVNVTGSYPTNEPPVAQADPYYQEVGVGESAWFSGSNSYDPDGFIVSYEWDFGDGNFGYGENTYHSYDAPGDYTVTLTVTDNEGAVGTDTCLVHVVGIYPAPPADLDAELVTVSLSDVKLAWSASSDDGAGDDDVDGYTIYKSTTGINGLYEYEDWIPASGIPAYTYDWTDIGAGDGDWNSYFYIVRVKDVYGNEEQNDIKVGKFANQLDDGWNLISIPIAQKDTSRETVLQTIDGNYAALQGYYAGKSRPWLHWHRDKPNYFNDDIEVDHKKGYYIDMIVPDYLITAGKVASQTDISLKSGWNLVGYPGLFEQNVADALSSIDGDYNMLEYFDPIKDKEVRLKSNDLMIPDFGYWIHATADCVLTITN
jgi:PKD repeat protein